MDALKSLVDALNSLTPLAVGAGLGGGLAYIIYLLVQQKKAVASVSDNHLSGLPQLEKDVAELIMITRQQNQILHAMNNNIVYLVAKANGAPRNN